MKRYLISAVIFALVAGVFPLTALDGQVITVNGKVEFQATNGKWKPMKAGDSVTAGTVISTGFRSEATVKLGGSILTIKPLTRLSLTQLVEKTDTVETELFLEVGNVKAEVNSFDNKKNGFTVKSPVATASVRGTIFEMGDHLVVSRGSVLYLSAIGQSRIGNAGQQLQVFGESITSPVTMLQTNMNTIALSTIPSTEATSPIKATTASVPVPPPVPTAAPVAAPETRVTLVVN
jgi:hypothetical protein